MESANEKIWSCFPVFGRGQSREHWHPFTGTHIPSIGPEKMPTMLLILMVTSCTLGSQLVLKNGVSALTAVLRSEGALSFLMAAATSPKVILALALQGLGYVIWLFVLTQERLSVAFAISGSFLILVTAAASWLVFDERLTVLQWSGLVLISAGVLIVNFGGNT